MLINIAARLGTAYVIAKKSNHSRSLNLSDQSTTLLVQNSFDQPVGAKTVERSLISGMKSQDQGSPKAQKKQGLVWRTYADGKKTVVIGRHHLEIMTATGLTIEDLNKNYSSVLDIAGGTSSLTAFVNQLKLRGCSVDLFNNLATEVLVKEARANNQVFKQIALKSKGKSAWEPLYADPKQVRARFDAQETAFDLFEEDRKQNPNAYITGDMTIRFDGSSKLNPKLNTNSYDLIIQTNSLFLNSNYSSIKRNEVPDIIPILNEMMRIANKEIRIYPTVNENGNRNILIDAIVDDLRRNGITTFEIEVPSRVKRFKQETTLVITDLSKINRPIQFNKTMEQVYQIADKTDQQFSH